MSALLTVDEIRARCFPFASRHAYGRPFNWRIASSIVIGRSYLIRCCLRKRARTTRTSLAL